jgi:hypothetical protein
MMLAITIALFVVAVMSGHYLFVRRRWPGAASFVVAAVGLGWFAVHQMDATFPSLLAEHLTSFGLSAVQLMLAMAAACLFVGSLLHRR